MWATDRILSASVGVRPERFVGQKPCSLHDRNAGFYVFCRVPGRWKQLISSPAQLNKANWGEITHDLHHCSYWGSYSLIFLLVIPTACIPASTSFSPKVWQQVSVWAKDCSWKNQRLGPFSSSAYIHAASKWRSLPSLFPLCIRRYFTKVVLEASIYASG